MSTDEAPIVSLELKRYTRRLRTQWRVVIACALLGVLLAGAYLVFVPRSVTATATLQLNVISTDPFSAQRADSTLIDGATESAIPRSRVVAGAAEDQLDGRLSADQIRDATSAEVSDGTTIMRIAFTTGSADLAKAGADAVAKSYLEFQEQRAETRISGMVSTLNERIEKLNTALAKANAAITAAGDSSQHRSEALAQQQQVSIELEGLIASRSGLQTVDTSSGTVLTSGADSQLDFAPSRIIMLLTGLMIGLVIGIALAFSRRPLIKRARSVGAVAYELEVPNLTRHHTGTKEIDLEETARLVWQYALNAESEPSELLFLDVRIGDGLPDLNLANALTSVLSTAAQTAASSSRSGKAGGGRKQTPLANTVQVRTVHAAEGEAALLAAIRRAQVVVVVTDTRGASFQTLRTVSQITSQFDTSIIGCAAEPIPTLDEPGSEEPMSVESEAESKTVVP